MAGISAKLPLARDPDDGIGLNKDFRDSVRQNIIMLLLTIPGERMMIPDFGVGLKTYLFEQDNEPLRQEISAKFREQLDRYLPFVDLINISYASQADDPTISENTLVIGIEYAIVPLDAVDVLVLEASELDNSIVVRPNDLTTII